MEKWRRSSFFRRLPGTEVTATTFSISPFPERQLPLRSPLTAGVAATPGTRE
jgi:hypothetical protein